MSQKIYILYHKNCLDGFGAAYAAWKKFGNKAEYIPVTYGKEPPEMEPESQVYILDFSYSKEILQEMSKTRKVLVLDHHKSAKEDLDGLAGLGTRADLKAHFDMNHSGAVLAWKYFHGTPIPKLLQHIEDRDLWKFQLKGTKEVNAYLNTLSMEFEVWDPLVEDGIGLEVMHSGTAILREKRKTMEMIASQAFVKNSPFGKAVIVNATSEWSELGNYLCEQYPRAEFSVSWYQSKDGGFKFSLRSRGSFDVSEICKKFGGGGHRNAAGFVSKTMPEEFCYPS